MARADLRAVPDTPPRAVLYLRQSTYREESISLELQETAGRDYCARRGYDVVAVVSDPGISGRTFKRPGVTRVMDMVEAHDADVVVLWKWSRLSRSRRDWALAADRVEVAGGRIESATEPVDVATSVGRLARGVLTEFAAFESERIGEQWKEAHQHRLKRGLPHTGRPRVGYTYDKATGYTINPETRHVAEGMYQRYIDGAGPGEIARWLHEHGKVNSIWHGERMSAVGVQHMLDAGFAAGYLHIHDPACRCGKTCGNRILVQGAHKAVVGPEMWAAYQRERATRRGRRPPPKDAVSALSGLVICGGCSRPAALQKSHGVPKAAYVCQSGWKSGPACQNHVHVRRDVVEVAVRRWLPTVADEIADVTRRAAKGGGAATRRAERKRLLRVAGEAQKALDRLTLSHARGVLDETSYVAARAELTAERDEAQRAAAVLAAEVRADDWVPIAAALDREWHTLAAADRNRLARNLLRVVATRIGPYKGTDIKVVGLWAFSDGDA